MAQEIVSSLLLKLANAVIQEAITLYGVKDKVEPVQHDLRWIQSFLKDADAKRKGDNRVQIWVKEVREVSFLIEDTIDTFLFEVESLGLKKPGVCNTIKRVCKKPMKLVAMHNLDSAINKIQAMVKKIKENKESYGIKDLGDSQIMKVPNRPSVIPEIDEIDLVGFNTEKNKVIELLLDENISRRSVVSIVGQGGLGKTTLAEKVFQSDEIKQHFDVQVWLTISQDFKPIELLKKILGKASGTKIEKEYDEEYYLIEVNKLLKEKKYLIVLDDIWSNVVWPRIKVALPDQNNASRVLITTRFFEIAKEADPQSDPHKLRFLNEEESLKLLFKKALPGGNFNDQGYPPELIEIAKSFSKQCGGLPLALVVVGGLLSTKDRTGIAWDRVLNTMDWQTDGNKCTEILATSFEDMPVHLKTCFLYLASFPDDTPYQAEDIIRLWNAEGFIPHDARGTMEQRAIKYLEELAQRCMIQVTDKTPDGGICWFRVHDLLLDLAIWEAKEKEFLNVFPKKNNSLSSSVARRASFQLNDYSWDDTKQLMLSIPNVRTLFFFGKVVPFDSQFKLLRVLMIYRYQCPDGKDDPCWLNNIKRLLHLRYLEFAGCDFRKFVFVIDNLHNLRTLIIINCSGIIASNIVLKDSEPILGIKSLKDVHCNIGIVIEIAPNTPNLQITDGDLKLLDTDNPHLILTIKTDSWKQSFTRLSKLKESYPGITIVSLQLNARIIPISKVIQIKKYLIWNNLSSLYLNGEIQPKYTSLGTYLEDVYVLTLSHSYIEHDPMLVFKSNPYLHKLVLYKCAYVRKQMICSRPQGSNISNLNYLEISLLDELEEWHIEDGAIPRLNHLIIHKCPKLRMLPALQYCRELETLELKGMPKKFIRRVQNEDQYKIKHIPKIIINNRSFQNRIREESESESGDSNF